jgi:hypothetical protein
MSCTRTIEPQNFFFFFFKVGDSNAFFFFFLARLTDLISDFCLGYFVHLGKRVIRI